MNQFIYVINTAEYLDALKTCGYYDKKFKRVMEKLKISNEVKCEKCPSSYYYDSNMVTTSTYMNKPFPKVLLLGLNWNANEEVKAESILDFYASIHDDIKTSDIFEVPDFS